MPKEEELEIKRIKGYQMSEEEYTLNWFKEQFNRREEFYRNDFNEEITFGSFESDSE